MKRTPALLALVLIMILPFSVTAHSTGPQAAAKPAAASAGAAALSPATVLPPGFDAYVAKVMKTFEVPGLAVAVVKDGRVVLAKGYGVRKLGEPAPVDAQTLFGIASNTKAFTATALGLLVEEGKLEWDAPVIDYLPWFQMSDPYITREMTVRDLLVHRSGLGEGAGDLLLWPKTTYTRNEIVRRIRFLPIAGKFRYGYAYDNILYLVAGEVIQAVSGMPWEDFIAERILKRAGMASSRPRAVADLAGLNIAAPYTRLGSGLVPRPIEENDNMNPAGGILSCAEDMARWMLVHLNEGRIADGTRLFSERTERELTAPVTPIRVSSPPAELAAQRMSFYGYALGFRVNDYRGRRLVGHTGSVNSYFSRLIMVPEMELGITVMTSRESSQAYNSVVYAVLDQAMGAPPTDWIDAYVKVRDRARAASAGAVEKAGAKRDASLKPSLPLEAYARTYEDAWYGPIVVTLEGAGEAARLVMSFAKTPGFVGDMEHWSRETFVVRWRDRGQSADAYVTFSLDPDGAIVEARMKAVSPDTDTSFDFQDLRLMPLKK